MKNKLYTLLLLFSAVAGLGGCSSDDDSCVGIDCLPEATQTGAGTFGCLVNGEPFVDNSGDFNCFYQLVDGEYYFGINGTVENNTPRSIGLATKNLELNENSIYNLSNNEAGNAYGTVLFYPLTNGINFNHTSDDFSGVLEINKIDLNDNIISGTFYFSIKDTIENKTFYITNGRFDAQFNQ